MHLVKRDDKMVWHKSFSNELDILAQGVVNIVAVSDKIFFIPKSQVLQDQKLTQ